MTAVLLDRASASIVAPWRRQGGETVHPTDRWRDKRAQGARRSGDCFLWAFSLVAQGAGFDRSVRPLRNAVISLDPSHIAGGGDGR